MTEIQKLGKGISASLLSNIWLMLLLLLLTPIYIKLLGIESYGLIGFYTSCVAILGILDMGFSTTATREIAWLSVRADDKQAIPGLMRTLEVVYWAIVLVLTVLLFFWSWVYGAEWFQEKGLSSVVIRQALMLMTVSLAFQVPSGIYMGGLLGLQRQAQSACLLALFGTMKGVGAIIVLWFINPDIRAFFLWQIVISILQTVVSRTTLWRQIHPLGGSAKFSWDHLRTVRRFAGGMTLITALSVIVSQMDKVILSRMITLDNFGYYMLAWSVASALMLVANPVMQSFGPHYTSLISANDHDSLSKRVRIAAQMMSFLILPPAALLIYFSDTILSLWIGNQVIAGETAPVLAVLTAGTALVACTYPVLHVLYSKKQLKPVIWMQLVVLLVFLPVLLWVIPRFGMMGAAYCWATFGLVFFVTYRVIGLRSLSNANFISETWQDFVLPGAIALTTCWLWSLMNVTSTPLLVITALTALTMSWLGVLLVCRDLRMVFSKSLKWA